MGSPHYQQSLHRKILYIALILAILFVLVFFYRPYLLEAKAEALSLRDQDRGEVELTGKVVTLGLSGLRGVMITALWSGAKDKMEKNQWNELELLVRSVTKLQPHFVTPWLFQSWNLSYNVAVKCDREADQYFYITRGIELLGEGERQNRYNPEMRYYLGFYNQHKIMLADRTNMLAALYHMSSIDPVQRDPRRFRRLNAEGQAELDMLEFEKFCRENPQLVRRLREKVLSHERGSHATPEDVVQFLDENQRLPSLFEDDPERLKRTWSADEQTRKRPVGDRFPVLPPPSHHPAPEDMRLDQNALTYESRLEDHVDSYLVARAWYSYAVEPLPEPDWIPGRYKPITDPARQKLPRFTTQLFRNYPARAQSYVADRLEQDGWFDTEGWLITGWFPRDQFSDQRPAVVGDGHNWTQDAWTEAFDMWRKIGERHHLMFPTAEEERNVKLRAEEWQKKWDVPLNQPPPEVPEEQIKDEGMRAFIFLWNYDYYRRLSNFPHFLYQAMIFRMPETVEARKHFYLAEKARGDGDRRQAIEQYEKALPAYNALLKVHDEFRNEGAIAEETLDYQWNYLVLCRELHGRQWKQALALQAFLGLAAGGPAPEVMPLAQLGRPHILPEIDMKGPLDDTYGERILEDYQRIKNPPKGPPPGAVDLRQMMMNRQMSTGPVLPGGRPVPPGAQPQGPVPGGMMPPGMQPPGGGPGGLPPAGKKAGK